MLYFEEKLISIIIKSRLYVCIYCMCIYVCITVYTIMDKRAQLFGYGLLGWESKVLGLPETTASVGS